MQPQKPGCLSCNVPTPLCAEDLDTLLRQQPKKLHKPALSLARTAAAKPATSSSGSEAEGDATEAEAGSHAQTSEELPAAQQPELGAALAATSSLQRALLAAASAQAAPLPAPAEPPATKPRPAARGMGTQTRRLPLTVASAQTAPGPAMKSSAAQTQQPRRPPLRLAVQVQTEAWQPTYRSVGIQVRAGWQLPALPSVWPGPHVPALPWLHPRSHMCLS